MEKRDKERDHPADGPEGKDVQPAPRLAGSESVSVTRRPGDPPSFGTSISAAVSRGAFYFPRTTPPRSGLSVEENQTGGSGGEQGEAAEAAREESALEKAVWKAGAAEERGTAPGAPSNPVDELLRRLLEVARRAVSLLEEEDPDPHRLEAVLKERSTIFARLQGEVEGETAAEREQVGVGSRRKAIVKEIRRLDARCAQLARQRLTEARGRLDEVKLWRRVLVAYGWIGPESAVRGAFVDTTD